MSDSDFSRFKNMLYGAIGILLATGIVSNIGMYAQVAALRQQQASMQNELTEAKQVHRSDISRIESKIDNHITNHK